MDGRRASTTWQQVGAVVFTIGAVVAASTTASMHMLV
jgi:hypothetical protein